MRKLMAKVSAHGTEVYRNESGNRRYRLMSDGVILRQLRIMGKWETPTIAAKSKSHDAAIRWIDRMI